MSCETLIRKILSDECFLAQQDQWNTAELRTIADNVHDVRCLQADDDANGPLGGDEGDSSEEEDSLTVLSSSSPSASPSSRSLREHSQ